MVHSGAETDYQGSHPLFVNDSENAAGVDSERLVQIFFPDVTGRRHPLYGRETLVSIDQARALIGYEPEHHISDPVGASYEESLAQRSANPIVSRRIRSELPGSRSRPKPG